MLSVRNAILASLVLLLIVFIGGAVNLMGEPDSGGAAADSYGTQRDGYRATYELLSEFGVPVERRIAPPDVNLPVNSTLVIWGPHHDLVENEPLYLTKLLPWIEQGGRLVVAPPPRIREVSLLGNHPLPQPSRKRHASALWSALGLEDLEVTDGPKLLETEDENNREFGLRRDDEDRWEDILREATDTNIQPTSIVQIVATGDWMDIGERVKHLRIPSNSSGQLSIPAQLTPTAQLQCQHAKGGLWTLAAKFPRGRGEIIAIADPQVLGNGQIAKDDNAVLTFDMLHSGDRPVIFDEFYHGLSVRGNPLWLLTRPGAGLLVAVFLLTTLVWIWRQSFQLGPPLDALPRSRRAIQEYIDAMARFLTRSKQVNPFLLTESREGVLRLLGAQLNLPPGRHEASSIHEALNRRSPTEAKVFQDALRQLDNAIQQRDRVTATNTIQSIEGLFRCL